MKNPKRDPPKLTTFFAGIATLLTLACPVTAQTDTDRIISAFELWQTEQSIPNASIAIISAGDAMITKDYAQEANRPITLASLSKAITGACIAVLQREGVFNLDADIAGLLDIPGVEGTLGDFLSHSAGLAPDRTQGKPWHLEPDRAPLHQEAAATALAGPRGDSGFFYSNENYAVLGAVIDAVAEVDYDADCRKRVLDPLGITTAKLDPVWGPLGAWGGWAMSTADYARFVKEWFGSNRNIGRDPRSWPHAELGQGAAYVMGAFYRHYQGAELFWHAGLLCWDGEGDGSYFVSFGGDPIVVVSFKGCIDNAGFAALDQALFEAARQ